MIIIYAILIAVTAIIQYTQEKKFFSPNMVFTFMWTFFPALSSLGVYGLNKPSLTVHLLSIGTVVVFNTVYYLFINKNQISNSKKIHGRINYKFIIVLNLVSLLYAISFLPTVFEIINTYGFDYLRSSAFDSDLGLATTNQLVIMSWFVQSVIIVTTILGIIDYKENKHYLILVFSIIGIIIYTILFGGRYLLVRFLFYYISFHLVTKEKNKTKFSKGVMFLLLSILVVTVIVGNLRSNTSFIKSVIIYYTGPFPYLDSLITTNEFSNNYLYGQGIFGFIYNVITAPFTILFNIEYLGSNYVISSVTSHSRIIGEGIRFNAMSTMLYPFLFDFGFFGVLIGVLFVFFLTVVISNNFKNNYSYRNTAFFLFMMFVLFDSVMSYQLLFSHAGITLLLIYITTMKVRK